jgi:hypothetical protein
MAASLNGTVPALQPFGKTDTSVFNVPESRIKTCPQGIGSNSVCTTVANVRAPRIAHLPEELIALRTNAQHAIISVAFVRAGKRRETPAHLTS